MIAVGAARLGWQDQAACRGSDLFFGPYGELPPETERRETAAKKICAVCPVRALCDAYADGRPERYGVWGAVGESERWTRRKKAMRQAREIKVA